MRAVLLGPQRFRQPAGQAVRELAGDRPVAVTNAGWLMREAEDAELLEVLGPDAVNLQLHRRWNDVMDNDSEFAEQYGRHAARVAEHQALYEIRLHAALDCFHLLWRRTVQDPGLHDGALTAALAAVRDVDAWHLYQTRVLAEEFAGHTEPATRASIAPHRAEVMAMLSDAAVLAVAGGHVGVLLDCLETFGVAEVLASATAPAVVAWSAGAMALADVVLLFGDDTPQGHGHPEIHRAGLGVYHRLIPLPHARRRLRLADKPRVAALAGRFPRSACVILDDGVKVPLPADGSRPGGLPTLTITGDISTPDAA